MDKTIKTLTEVLQESKKEGTTPYDTTAEVVRIEGKTAWCHIPGGIDETPVSMTIDAKVGDVVQVRVSGGRAWITGNSSAPPTDDTVANVANKSAKDAKKTADDAQVTAENAEEVANAANRAAQNVNQYFWHTETDTGAGAGAHITEVTQEEFLDDPSNGGGNLLAQSGGIFIRDGLTELATMTATDITIGDTANQFMRVDATGGVQFGKNTIFVGEAKVDELINELTIRELTTKNCIILGQAGAFIGYDGHDGIKVDYDTYVGHDLYVGDNYQVGNINASGNITAGNHSTPIGYNNTGSGTKNNFPNNSQQELVSGISVTAGTWLLICRVGFPSNATGRRFACWHNNTTAADYYTSYSTSPAANGGYTNVQTVMAIQVSGNTTFSVHAFQNSGSAMNVAYNWSIVRIA